MKINKNGSVLIYVSLVVIVVVALLFVIVAATRGDKGDTVDQKRKTNLLAIQEALEKCFSDNRSYDQDIYSQNSCISTKMASKAIPTDPVTGANYIYNSSGYPAMSYTISAQMDKLRSEENIDENGLMVLKNKQ